MWRIGRKLSLSASLFIPFVISKCDEDVGPMPANDYITSQPTFGVTTNLRKPLKRVRKIEVPDDEMIVIAGSAHKELSESISKELNVPLCLSKISRFADGEVSVQLDEDVLGKNVFIVQPCVAPVNDSIMELIFTVSCAKRAGAKRVTAVVPYFGYKHHRRGSSISSVHHSRHLTSNVNDFAKMLKEMGVDRVISVDVQRPGQGQEACVFDNTVPLESIITTNQMVRHVASTLSLSSNILVVSPNTECVKKARNFQIGLQKILNNPRVHLAVYNSEFTDSDPYKPSKLRLLTRLSNEQISQSDIIIVDDTVDTASTISKLSSNLFNEGAKNIYVCASHGLFTEDSVSKIENSPISRVIVTDSLPLPKVMSSKIDQIPMAETLAKAMLMEYRRNDESFDDNLPDKYVAAKLVDDEFD